MTKNPILDELRGSREKLLAESGGTGDGLVNRRQAEERVSDRLIREARQNQHRPVAMKVGDGIESLAVIQTPLSSALPHKACAVGPCDQAASGLERPPGRASAWR